MDGCIRALLTTAIALAALACAPAPPPAPPGGAADQQVVQPAAAPAPKRGGVLQWTPVKGGKTLHPHDGANTDILRHTGAGYETLLSFRYEPGQNYLENLQVIPWLAESWQQPDDLTYQFSIRQGVRWHDGEAFTAADVEFTYNWLRQEKRSASARLAEVDTIQATERYTLRITLKRAAPDFLQELAEKNLLVVAKHVVERGDDLHKVLVGTGPFRIKSFRSGIESLWERNNEYWQPGRPYMDGVRQVWGLEEKQPVMAAFVAGENDLMVGGNIQEVEQVRQVRPRAGFMIKTSDNGISILLKLDRPPFNDVRVRRAVHLAVDRQAMDQLLNRGTGLLATPGVWAGRQGWAIPQEELRSLPGYRSPKAPDIAEAKRLLAEAGYPQGFSFDMIYDRQGNAAKLIGETIPDQLRAIGVTANLRPLETGVYNQADIRTGSYEGGSMPSTINAQFRGLYDRFHSKGPINKTGLSDPTLDDLIERVLTGKDLDARKRAARQLQERFLEHAYNIPTVELVTGGLWQPWVHDYVYTSGGVLSVSQDSYPQMWLDTDALPASRR